jgi:excisionase family DNA binding protein
MSSPTSTQIPARSEQAQRARRRYQTKKDVGRETAKPARGGRPKHNRIAPIETSPTQPAPGEAGGPKLFDVKEKTITVKEAAFRLNKTEDAIRRWLRTGRLQGWQPGGRCCSVMVLESSVEQQRSCALGSAVRGPSSRSRQAESTRYPPPS